MELDALLRAHGFMRTEAPPELWEADTQDEPFLRMLGEMTVEPDEDPVERAWADPGDYGAITVRGAGSWEDDVWRAGQGPTKGVLVHVGPAADEAGAVVAYARDLGAEGSVTALVPRLVPSR